MPHPWLDVWSQAHRDFRDIADRAPWRHDTLLPGWTVGDIVAHTAWIERLALRRQDPLHEPDWDALPHAVSDFGRATEVPVDLRRSWPKERVMAQLDEAVAARRAVLEATPADATATNVFGAQRPLGDVLRDRIFDLWVHEQDIRVPCGEPGHLDTEPGRIAAQVLIGGLGFVWAKRAAAPSGATLTVVTTPPGQVFAVAVERQADGRARPVAAPASPTVTLRLSFPQFVAHTCGRRNADPAAVTIEGELSLGRAVVAGLAITP